MLYYGPTFTCHFILCTVSICLFIVCELYIIFRKIYTYLNIEVETNEDLYAKKIEI